MKVLMLAPSDMTTEATIAGLQSLPHDVIVYRYDKNGVPVDRGMLDVANYVHPDVLVYIGQNNHPFLAAETTFKSLKNICPTVLLAFDGSDETWTALLTKYEAENVFTLIVNIDGSSDWPRRDIDFTALTPVCLDFYT